MQARFLLGPAGSGKTFRCLAEVRAALAAAPDGEPLVFLAPKQATFQLERQLLAGGGLGGFSRLRILSFDALARFVLEQSRVAPPALLSAEGRVMVLRALLLRHEKELSLFGRSARRPGFAQELSGLLTELQQHRFTPEKLRALAGRENPLTNRSAGWQPALREPSGETPESKAARPQPDALSRLQAGAPLDAPIMGSKREISSEKILPRELRGKLNDLALLLEKYAAWLAAHQLQDADRLLDAAVRALGGGLKIESSKFKIAGLWLDGFAEMTPQELALLAAVIPVCGRATLAFCLETGPAPETSWQSIWAAVGKTFQQCRAQIANLPGVEVAVEILPRAPGKNRFAENSPLAELERGWARGGDRRLRIADCGLGQRVPAAPAASDTIRLVACENPEAEAAFAAREILKFVRADPARRFRDCAVLVRSLGGYRQPLTRAFRRYGVPIFLDQRESITHHPLTELTRSALRTVAFDWRIEDWFAALKAGFSPVAEEQIDRLENAALQFGWRGKKWREPLPDEFGEKLRERLFPPYEKFSARLAGGRFEPVGAQLADALRALWGDLNVGPTLEAWARAAASPAAVHLTVLEQMNDWLDNLARAFPTEALPLREWLPVLESGLAGLTVGVIPPALDQVLIGAIDRARNPDLKLGLVLGVNESVFPAPPAAPVILNRADRDELERQNAALGAGLPDRVSRENYLGYIAGTRAGERLVITYARQNAGGQALNPSAFVKHIREICALPAAEEFFEGAAPRDAQHALELTPLLVPPAPPIPALAEIPAVKSLAEKLAALREPLETENLSPATAEQLYGPMLCSSVSRLEEFAACPFKFFTRVGLRAGERKQFELDARERGNFQHDVLKEFHEQTVHEGRRWRDLTPAEARARIAQIAAARMEDFRAGLFRDSAETRFAAQSIAVSLQDFVEVIVGWLRTQYEFDPVAAELGFGGRDDRAAAWEIDLGHGHRLALNGRIDRVDLWREPGGDTALAVVMDYKSSGKKLEPLLMENGIQLQLLAYLGALRRWRNPAETFGAKNLRPAGAFYVSLRGAFEAGGTRDEILQATDAKKLAYRHHGRFDAGQLPKLDRRREVASGDQFNYRLNKGGRVASNSSEALPAAEFEAMLAGVETQLWALGERIFSGAAQVDPYRKGKATPCEFCDYHAVCRIDKWTHEWRVLRAKEKP